MDPARPSHTAEAEGRGPPWHIGACRPGRLSTSPESLKKKLCPWRSQAINIMISSMLGLAQSHTQQRAEVPPLGLGCQSVTSRHLLTLTEKWRKNGKEARRKSEIKREKP
jgi:hypothetical protein